MIVTSLNKCICTGASLAPKQIWFEEKGAEFEIQESKTNNCERDSGPRLPYCKTPKLKQEWKAYFGIVRALFEF